MPNYVVEYDTPTLQNKDIFYYTMKEQKDILSAIDNFHRYFPKEFIRVKSVIEVRENTESENDEKLKTFFDKYRFFR